MSDSAAMQTRTDLAAAMSILADMGVKGDQIGAEKLLEMALKIALHMAQLRAIAAVQK